jgi:predicted transcriptional regulator
MDITVKKWMHKNVAIAKFNDSAKTAANEMVKKKVGSLIVTDKENKPIGIVTETDFVRKVVASGVSSKMIQIEDIMSGKMLSIESDKDITDASEMMKNKNIKRLPVVENEKVVGIITSTDLVNAMAKLAND